MDCAISDGEDQPKVYVRPQPDRCADANLGR